MNISSDPGDKHGNGHCARSKVRERIAARAIAVGRCPVHVEDVAVHCGDRLVPPVDVRPHPLEVTEHVQDHCLSMPIESPEARPVGARREARLLDDMDEETHVVAILHDLTAAGGGAVRRKGIDGRARW